MESETPRESAAFPLRGVGMGGKAPRQLKSLSDAGVRFRLVITKLLQISILEKRNLNLFITIYVSKVFF